MAHRQTWALSQTANKNKGTCSVCGAIRQIHMTNGTLHLHGPRKKPCTGSNKPPIDSNKTPTTSTANTSQDQHTHYNDTTRTHSPDTQDDSTDHTIAPTPRTLNHPRLQ